MNLNKPGIYFLKDKTGKIIYIGKSINLQKRLSYYFTNFSRLGPKTKALVSQTEEVEFIFVESEIEALLLEARLIRQHLPRFNSRSKDDKRPLFIKITDEELPRVLVSRKKQPEKGIFFGPFPSTKTVKQVLRFLRKIFPFCSCLGDKKRPCIYAHIGLCQPSPRIITSLSPEEKKHQVKIYRKNIKNLIRFLRGGKNQLIIRLENEMKKAASHQEFEKAATLRDQIRGIRYVTQSFCSPKHYLENPNLFADRRREEKTALAKIMKETGLIFKNPPTRIEAFDISGFAGKKTTGSMVVFINGEPEKDLYRRFKIMKKHQNDPAMIKEILTRRLAHPEWGSPDLILVDGGKGQVAAAKKAILQNKKNIPVIGLAKREEKIIIPQEKGFFTLRLPRTSPALHLLQRLRDEAHRFALSYHRLLRQKLID